jgi:2-C-methyl-D-erythritol 4-phosphate cytidylyltransferase
MRSQRLAAGSRASAPCVRPHAVCVRANAARNAHCSASFHCAITSAHAAAAVGATPRMTRQEQQQRVGRVRPRAGPAGGAESAAADLADGSVSVVLLAGGVGKRMGAAIPKQYLELAGQPIATYALDTFAGMREVGEVVIVCDPSWRYVFEARLPKLAKQLPVKWALPGAERQDSVANGLAEVSPSATIVAVHDSARPLVSPADAARCMRDGAAVGAAVLGVPVKPTIKEVDANMNVVKTLVRAALWEVQTPQCIRPALLREGFELVRQKGLEVTDDVSIIEAMGLPVKITPGSYTNIKVTTPDDMSVALGFMDDLREQRRAAAEAAAAAAAAA